MQTNTMSTPIEQTPSVTSSNFTFNKVTNTIRTRFTQTCLWCPDPRPLKDSMWSMWSSGALIHTPLKTQHDPRDPLVLWSTSPQRLNVIHEILWCPDPHPSRDSTWSTWSSGALIHIPLETQHDPHDLKLTQATSEERSQTLCKLQRVGNRV